MIYATQKDLTIVLVKLSFTFLVVKNRKLLKLRETETEAERETCLYKARGKIFLCRAVSSKRWLASLYPCFSDSGGQPHFIHMLL